jgi:hypothetical protein
MERYGNRITDLGEPDNTSFDVIINPHRIGSIPRDNVPVSERLKKSTTSSLQAVTLGGSFMKTPIVVLLAPFNMFSFENVFNKPLFSMPEKERE